jgi:hypothetical protein
MSPHGTIGGAILYQIGPDGTPANIEEKFESLYRAQFLAAGMADNLDGAHKPLGLDKWHEGKGSAKVLHALRSKELERALAIADSYPQINIHGGPVGRAC